MRTYTINACFINRQTGINETKTVEARTVAACGGWYFFETEYNGESLISDHGTQRKSSLIADSKLFYIDFIV